MTKHVLVKFNLDWADEFSAEGFAIATEEEYKAAVEYYSEPRTWYFGTNEGWEDEEIAEGFSSVEITEDEKAVLEKLFPDLVQTVHHFEHQGVTRTYTTGGRYGQVPPLTSFDEE
jgi:hypothetical protein